MNPEPKLENNLSNLPPYLSPEWHARNKAEVDGRPKVLPLDQRQYPCGAPDKVINRRVQLVQETGCIGNMSHHGK
jgi:hypothetical protein